MNGRDLRLCVTALSKDNCVQLTSLSRLETLDLCKPVSATDGFAVVLIAKDDNPVTHWVLVVGTADGKEAYYFDSLAKPTPTPVKRLLSGCFETWSANDNRVQFDGSTCGYWICFVTANVLRRNQTGGLIVAFDRFVAGIGKHSDRLVVGWFRQLFQRAE